MHIVDIPYMAYPLQPLSSLCGYVGVCVCRCVYERDREGELREGGRRQALHQPKVLLKIKTKVNLL